MCHQLPTLSSRGVQVGALFMAGVEAAVFANDACGEPLAWWTLAPWLYFDGKLFHFTLLRANAATSLLEVQHRLNDYSLKHVFVVLFQTLGSFFGWYSLKF